MALTTMRGEGSLVGMKKKLANLPLNALLQTAQLAGQNAAANAVAAGRRVAGWKNGCLVEYGQDAIPLPLPLSERKIASGGRICRACR